ncbi:Fn3-like domain-containing protein [Mucilaginibacter sp. JRF]|uniref:Fn3-like domain-containing protein n=1 Tax=Mucilaginibacter sp. JRF TaxID=2780088 RepID=UPI001882A3B2|nr:Fn3-like domain-containing protein [Mucilaginibacter sp. JRF]MBE9583109.1 Fn3-like domain-containing protein [Mucilaginibacter sp. JRF]
MKNVFKILKTQLLSFLVFLNIILISASANAQSISISPSRLFFTGNAGQELTEQVTLTNSGTTSVIFRSSLMDWKRDSIGEKQYAPANTLPSSNASWIEVKPNVITVPANGSAIVTVTMHVPAKLPTASVSNSMLFLTQINEQLAKTTAKGNSPRIGVSVKLEFGVHVYFTQPTALSKDLDIAAFDYRGIITEKGVKVRRFAIKVKSNGTVVTDGTLRFDITNQTTGTDYKVEPRALSFLPGNEQVVYLDLPVTLTGKYVLVALLDSGEETSLKVAKKEIDLKD